MVKVLIASLIVGTVLDHFGIRTDELINFDWGTFSPDPKVPAQDSAEPG